MAFFKIFEEPMVVIDSYQVWLELYRPDFTWRARGKIKTWQVTVHAAPLLVNIHMHVVQKL